MTVSNLKVKMLPDLRAFQNTESGIKRVVESYFRYLPEFGIDVVGRESEDFDIAVSHAGSAPGSEVLTCHGLYFTADYRAAKWEWKVNADVIASVRHAREVTVPSRWVQEVFQRDMRFSPHIVPHGIKYRDWEHDEEHRGYVLWNKNRHMDVCSPKAVRELALLRPNILFVSTFAPKDSPQNLKTIGLQPHDKMKTVIQRSMVYLSTTKETFGIGTLEAMAAGIPVLGFAYGGNLDLVEHGVNGYLATPDDYNGLANGLDFCIKHRKILGENGMEMAKKYNWLEVCEQVAGIYRLASNPQGPTVSIIIPSFNYSGVVGRAIASALGQTYKLIEKIIVVDDGSSDDGETERVVKEIGQKDNRVTYIRTSNNGVAIARNTGIAHTNSKFICCLDADDAIKPQFIEACVEALEKDQSLGVAYTGLWFIKPNGEEGLSSWPGECNFDEQLKQHNQIPTCTVFRKVMWERLGGYKQRYAPKGCGSEDAEFWLRAGAYGWGAEKVTNAGLFVYSWLSGRASGDKNYREVNWTDWHPWTKDNIHPFASLATPVNKISHPVRQYDEPTVSVVIPIGPSHFEKVTTALDSLEAQTCRSWEVIVVDDTDPKQFAALKAILRAYPYVRLTNTKLKRGAGVARNIGAKLARGPYLLFLDADDWLYPNAIQHMLDAMMIEESIIYTDYVGKAHISEDEARKLEHKERLLSYDYDTTEAVIKFRAADYDYNRAIAQPHPTKTYIWCLISSLLPTKWHKEIGGFDEKMPSWEDWDYWLRLARAGKCFNRVAEELLVYRFYTGTRREIGVQENINLVEYLRDKYINTEVHMCNCRNPKKASVITMNAATQQQEAQMAAINDDDLVLVKYNSLNRGQHKVIGMSTGTFYGHRGGGTKFYVHRSDIELQPHIFLPIENTTAATPEPAPTPEVPALIVPTKEPTTSPTEVVANEETKPAESVILDQILSDEVLTDTVSSSPVSPNLQLIPGVTADIAAQLNAMNVHTPTEIAELGKDELMAIKGIGEARANTIIEYAAGLQNKTPIAV